MVDLRRGLAVRARGGRRDTYAPIESVAGENIPIGDATALARQYVDRFGISSLYIADLDAIEDHTPQHVAVQTIADVDVTVWLDAGIASPDDARHALMCGASRLIVGLETLPDFEVLASIEKAVGCERVVFSLDLRDGHPIATTPELAQQSPQDLSARAADAGVSAMLMLDLARVGSASGVDLRLLEQIRARVSTLPLYVGGGIRSMDDLRQAQSAGCDGALVASALLDGNLDLQPLP